MTWHGVLYFLFNFFLLVWPLRSPDWEVCLAGNIAKKTVAICNDAPLIFYRKMWWVDCVLQIVIWWFRLSINATKIETTSVLTRTSRYIHLQILYKLFTTILSQKRTVIFCDFFTFVPFTSSVINYYLSYDIIWCVILFSIHYRQFTVKTIKFKETSRGQWWIYYPYPLIANRGREIFKCLCFAYQLILSHESLWLLVLYIIFYSLLFQDM